MLGVMLFHLGNLFPAHGPLPWLVRETFWWGVDLFLFLSGLGCSYALQRHGRYRFYIRRAERVLPVIILAGCLKSLASEGTFNWASIHDLRRLLCFDQWYVVTYLVLVALYPLMDKILRRFRHGGLLLFAVISIQPALAMAVLPSPVYQLGIVSWTLTRAPAFVLGAWMALLYAQGNDILKRFAPGVHLCWILAMAAAYFTLHQYYGKTGFATDTPVNLIIFVSLALPSFCYLSAKCLDRLHRSAELKGGGQTLFPRILALFGTMSLELYLVHEFFYSAMLSFSEEWSLPVFMLAGFGVSLLSAFLLHKGTAFLLRFLSTFLRRNKLSCQPDAD